jgi:hypothetical protein
MRKHAVVLTYPGHFYLSQITIKSLKKHINPNNITVIVDDISTLTWDGYVDDCKLTYVDCNIIQTSNFDFLKIFEGDPWIRQQMVKLLLHKILPFNEWFFTDGDIEFFQDIPYDITPYTIATIPMDVWDNWETAPMEDKGALQMANYINSMLDITDFWCLPADYPLKPNKLIVTSGVPFRDMFASRLKDLQSWIEHKHQKSLIEIHKKMMEQRSVEIAMSEWELMEAFRLYVRNEDLKMCRISPQSDETILTIYEGDDLHFITRFQQDSSLSKEFFSAKGIKISEKIWSKIPQKRY